LQINKIWWTHLLVVFEFVTPHVLCNTQHCSLQMVHKLFNKNADNVHVCRVLELAIPTCCSLQIVLQIQPNHVDFVFFEFAIPHVFVVLICNNTKCCSVQMVLQIQKCCKHPC
jgi:hypothetical protein